MSDQEDEQWLTRSMHIAAFPELVPDILLGGQLKMNMFIDCEYNGMGGQLISIALVPESDQLEPFYRELIINEPIEAWVNDNVLPLLNQTQFLQMGGIYAPCSRANLQADLAMYLKQYDSIHLISDWPDDIKYFCDLLITGPGTRIDTPKLTMEIRRDLDCVSEQPHNALADAIAIREQWKKINASYDL